MGNHPLCVILLNRNCSYYIVNDSDMCALKIVNKNKRVITIKHGVVYEIYTNEYSI